MQSLSFFGAAIFDLLLLQSSNARIISIYSFFFQGYPSVTGTDSKGAYHKEKFVSKVECV